MDTYVIDPRQVRDLTDAVILDKATGEPRILDADFYRATTMAERAMLGHRNALYGLPTRELVDWLRTFIAGRSAIEIGAGHGALAKAVGIPATDNWMQATALMQEIYAGSGQKTVQYGAHVERLDALDAIARHKPKVVVASWVTHKWCEARAEAGGNMFGVPEEEVIDACEAYVFIGNAQVHRNKSIWSRPHRIYHYDWLFSRSHSGTPDFIAVWGK